MKAGGIQPGRRASYTEGAGYGALSFVLMTILAIGSSIAIARLYGITVLGQYALAQAPLNIVWYLSSARERPAFIREVSVLAPRAPRVTGLFYAMLAFSTALTILVGALVMTGSYFLLRGPIDQPGLVAPAAVLILSYVLIQNPAWNLDAVLIGFRAGRELYWIRLHGPVAFLIFAVILAPLLGDVWGLVVAMLGSTVTVFIHRLFVVPRYMEATASLAELRSGCRTLPDLIRFGLKLVPGSIANGFSNEVGTWTLGIFGSITAVGAFSRAWNLARRLVEFNWRIAEMLLPTLVERHAVNDTKGFERARLDTIRYSALFLLLPAAAGGGAAEGVMAVFGPGFDDAAPALAILLLLPALNSVATIQQNALLAVDKPWSTSIASVIGAVVTVAAAIALTPSLGATGVACSMVAGVAARALSMSGLEARDRTARWRSTRSDGRHRTSELWPAREMLALGLAFIAGLGSARAIDAALPSLIGVVPALIAGTLAYGLCFWLAGGVNSRDRTRLGALRKRFRGRRQLAVSS